MNNVFKKYQCCQIGDFVPILGIFELSGDLFGDELFMGIFGGICKIYGDKLGDFKSKTRILKNVDLIILSVCIISVCCN
jgi:hypothetical protein